MNSFEEAKLLEKKQQYKLADKIIDNIRITIAQEVLPEEANDIYARLINEYKDGVQQLATQTANTMMPLDLKPYRANFDNQNQMELQELTKTNDQKGPMRLQRFKLQQNSIDNSFIVQRNFQINSARQVQNQPQLAQQTQQPQQQQQNVAQQPQQNAAVQNQQMAPGAARDITKDI